MKIFCYFVRWKVILLKLPKKLLNMSKIFQGWASIYTDLCAPILVACQLGLGFSLITAFEAEILLIDEFFSTGDANFIKKGSARLREIIQQSAIFVFASHNLELLEELCPKSVLIEKGKIINHDDTKKIIKQYKKTSVFDV